MFFLFIILAFYLIGVATAILFVRLVNTTIKKTKQYKDWPHCDKLLSPATIFASWLIVISVIIILPIMIFVEDIDSSAITGIKKLVKKAINYKVD